MKCPECGSENGHVIECRDVSDGRFRRRRECYSCGNRFLTYEVYVPDGLEPNPNMFRRKLGNRRKRNGDA